MQPPPDVPSSPDPTEESAHPPDDPLGRLAASARGWHRIQLAVLGFIGLCGILWAGGDSSAPYWIRALAGALVVAALVVAVVATYVIGRVAYPFYGPAVDTAVPEASTLGSGTRQLRSGIRMTYLAVALVVVATLSAWWPGADGASAVEVRDTAGQGWCGEIVDAPTGAVGLDTADGPVAVRADQIALLRPVSAC